jgi:hypothetical protein
MSHTQFFELAIAYANSINAIVILTCLLLAKHYGVLQYF